MLYGRIFQQTFLYFRDDFRNPSKCPQRYHHVLSGTKSPPNLPLFPHGPSDTCRSLAENDEARRWPDDSWRETWWKLGGGCGDYSWGRLGEAPTHKSAQIFAKAAQGGARAGAKFSAAIDKLRRRRLLLGEDLGKLAKGGGGFSWRRCRRCSETLPRPSPGDISWKLTGEKDTKLQAMKFCSFPGFFHILAKSPGVPTTVSN